MAGGMHTANNTHLNDVWSSQDGVSWEQHASAPWEARHRHGVLLLKGCSYVFGGTTKKNNTAGEEVQFQFNDVWKTCDAGRSWECVTESAQWSPREGFAFTVAEEKLLIIGGTLGGTGAGVNEVWASSDGRDWELLSSNETTPASAWEHRYATTAVTSAQGEVLLAGGFGDGLGAYKDVWASKDAGRTWEQRTARAEFGGIDYPAMATLGNTTYLIGGQAGAGQLFRSFRTVWATEDGGSSWTKVTEMPSAMAARGGMPVLDFDGSLLIAGGSSEIFPHADYNDVWTWRPESQVQVV